MFMKSLIDGAQEPLCSSLKARPTLKPKVTYYKILQEDGEYKLLVELTMWLSTHKHAKPSREHLAPRVTNLNPPA
jgi:hypothetical protein